MLIRLEVAIKVDASTTGSFLTPTRSKSDPSGGPKMTLPSEIASKDAGISVRRSVSHPLHAVSSNHRIRIFSVTSDAENRNRVYDVEATIRFRPPTEA